MRLHTIAAAACAFLLSVHHPSADAAGAKSKKAASSRSAAVKSAPAVRAGKSLSTRSASAKSRSKSKVKLKGVRPVAFAAALPIYAPPPEPPLSLAQLELAQQVQTGIVHCEFGQSVVVEPQARRAGAFHVRYGKAVYDMVPEETSTGAVRLSDATAGVMWLQIPVKSMLMDTRQGQRMVDACTTPFQRSAQAMAAAQSAQAGSFDTANGLGIATAQQLPAVANASPMPVASAEDPAGALAQPVVVADPDLSPSATPPITGPDTLQAEAAGAANPAGPVDSASDTSPPSGTGATSGAGSINDPSPLSAQPGVTAAVPARNDAVPATLPLPARPQ